MSNKSKRKGFGKKLINILIKQKDDGNHLNNNVSSIEDDNRKYFEREFNGPVASEESIFIRENKARLNEFKGEYAYKSIITGKEMKYDKEYSIVLEDINNFCLEVERLCSSNGNKRTRDTEANAAFTKVLDLIYKMPHLGSADAAYGNDNIAKTNLSSSVDKKNILVESLEDIYGAKIDEIKSRNPSRSRLKYKNEKPASLKYVYDYKRKHAPANNNRKDYLKYYGFSDSDSDDSSIYESSTYENSIYDNSRYESSICSDDFSMYRSIYYPNGEVKNSINVRDCSRGERKYIMGQINELKNLFETKYIVNLQWPWVKITQRDPHMPKSLNPICRSNSVNHK